MDYNQVEIAFEKFTQSETNAEIVCQEYLCSVLSDLWLAMMASTAVVALFSCALMASLLRWKARPVLSTNFMLATSSSFAPL